jgi:hypothetical protein
LPLLLSNDTTPQGLLIEDRQRLDKVEDIDHQSVNLDIVSG